MRIGLSVNTLEPWRNGGRLDGIGVYTKYLLGGLCDRGESVQPLSFSPFSGGERTIAGLSLGSSFSYSSAVGLLSGGRWRLAPDVDVYHATDYQVVPMRCPVVATLHDAIPMIEPSMSNPRLRNIKNFIMRKMAGYADMVVAVSNYSVAELIEYYRIDEGRIRVVGCGVGDEWLNPPDSNTRESVLEKYALSKGYFLSVGTLQPRKNIERVIAAHSLLPSEVRRECPLVVVGRRGWKCDALVDLLKRKEALGEVRWLQGVVNKKELRSLYSAATTFVFPSLYEGFGLPVLEAFASGIPVITSNTTSLPEVSAGIAWEVDPTMVEDIADAMEKSLGDENERQVRISAGIERARAMSWGRMVDQMCSLYRDLS